MPQLGECRKLSGAGGQMRERARFQQNSIPGGERLGHTVSNQSLMLGVMHGAVLRKLVPLERLPSRHNQLRIP